jgi:Transcriptional regulator, AbiEi antitoxin
VSEAGRETGNIGPFRGQAPIDQSLAALARAQRGVFTLEQLVAVGLSATAVRKRTAAGKLHRIYRGVYGLVPRDLLTGDGRLLAAVYACGPGAVLSHRSAAAMHELRRSDAARIDVTIPTRATRRQPGINVHRSTTLTAKDATTVRNIPCTTISRTLLDLAEVINRRGLERAFDQAEVLAVFDLRALEDQLLRDATRPASKIVGAVLVEHYAGSTVTWSDLEERFLKVVCEHGLPRPELNVFVDFHDGEPPVRADFVWRAERVLIETDGWKTHGTRQAFEYDRRLNQRAMVARWHPVRTTWRQLEHHPEQVVATAMALMNR